MKRIITMLFILIIITMSLTVLASESAQDDMKLTSVPETEVVYGDLTGNGKVELEDAQAALRAALRIIELEEDQYAAADVDGEEGLNLMDVQYILKYALRIITTFPIQDLQQPENPAWPSASPDPETQPDDEKEESEYMLNIQIGEHLLTAALVQNSSTKALLEMLADGPITINMQDYANMEKVGSLPEKLPRNDEKINTKAGDLILYQGNSFVIYYDTNSWSLTKLGKINNITQQELKGILGEGNVTVVLSLPSTSSKS